MLPRFLLIVCFFGSAISGDENPPQLEVLYYSSDPDLVWPPVGVDKDTPSSAWPGHGKQLATRHPRRHVHAAYNKGFPGPEDFYQNFVLPRQPVVFKGGIDHEVLEQLKSEKWGKTGRAALSFIEVANFLSPKKQLMSGREFVRGRVKNQWYSRGHLHKNFKDIFPLPKCLKCSYLTDILFDTRHVLFGFAFPLPVKQDKFHQMTCLVEGSKEILLVDNKEFPEADDLLEIEDLPYGKVSMLNSFNTDFGIYPALKKISKFDISLLGPGDCLYIPAGWISQTNVLSTDNSLEIRWKDEAWTPDSDCSKGPKQTLSELSFPGESYIGTDHTRDRPRKLMIRAASLIEMVVDKHLDIFGFMTAIARDQTLMPDLIAWTEECSERAEEFFNVLDMNKDGVIDNEDVDGVTGDNVEEVLGLVEDRLSDLDDIIIDQRVDYSLNHANKPTAKEREKQVQDAVAKVKKDMENKMDNVGDTIKDEESVESKAKEEL